MSCLGELLNSGSDGNDRLILSLPRTASAPHHAILKRRDGDQKGEIAKGQRRLAGKSRQGKAMDGGRGKGKGPRWKRKGFASKGHEPWTRAGGESTVASLLLFCFVLFSCRLFLFSSLLFSSLLITPPSLSFHPRLTAFHLVTTALLWVRTRSTLTTCSRQRWASGRWTRGKRSTTFTRRERECEALSWVLGATFEERERERERERESDEKGAEEYSTEKERSGFYPNRKRNREP